MYEHTLIGQVDALVNEGIISSDKRDKAVKVLQEKFWDKKIAIVWDVDDVIKLGEEQDIPVTEDEAKSILESILDNHDCSVGVTWDTLTYYIEEIEKAEKDELKETFTKELPTLIGKFKCPRVQRMLERRMKGIKNWEVE